MPVILELTTSKCTAMLSHCLECCHLSKNSLQCVVFTGSRMSVLVVSMPSKIVINVISKLKRQLK